MSQWMRPTTKLALFARDGLRCVYCDKPARALEPDHDTPRCFGGGNDPSNLLTACVECNARKSSMHALAFAAMRERKNPGTLFRVFDARARAATQELDRELARKLFKLQRPGVKGCKRHRYITLAMRKAASV